MEYALLLVVFIAFIFFSNLRRKNAATQLENSVKVGAKVVMAGGITGSITEIRGNSVVVETVPGTKIEFLKAAVRNVETPSLDEKAPKSVPATAKTASATAKKAATTTAKKTSASKNVTTKPKSTTTKSAK